MAKKISFLLKQDLYDYLQKKADEQSISVSALIRRTLIKNYQEEKTNE